MNKTPITNVERSVLMLNATWAFLLTQSIIVPFFTMNKISLANIFVIQAVHSVTLLISDLPSSYFADKFGSRWILIIACILRGIGGICFAFSNQLSEFLLSYVIIGLGNGFFSGINISTLFSDKEKTPTHSYYLFNKNYQYTRLMTITSLLIGSIMASFSVSFVANANAFIAWVPLLLAICIPIKHRNIIQPKSFSLISNIINLDHRLLTFILISAFYSFVPGFNLYMSQALFHRMGYPIYYYGIIISVCQLFSIFLSKIIPIYSNKLAIFIPLMAILPIVSYIFYLNENIVGFLIANISIEYCRYLNSTYLLSYLNVLCANNIRSIINSLINIISTVFFLLIGPIAGYLFDHLYYQSTALLCAMFFSLAGILVIFYIYKQRWGIT
ncbi:MAG: MFS transporter [Gammaproteobacteria bacterium]